MNANTNANGRIASIDVLRGFDMFWIIGGSALVCSFLELLAAGHLIPSGWCTVVAANMDHIEWAGLHFIDLIFPVFVFIAGLSYPFSHSKRLAAGETSLQTHLAILRRTFTLLLLGMLYNGFLNSDFHQLSDFRYFSVLGKIGIAWGVAALVYVHFGLKARLAAGFAGLAAYWIMLLCVAPDAPAGASSFSQAGCFVGWLDRHFTYGHLYCDNILEPSGPFVSFFCYPTALLGMCAGDLVRKHGATCRASLLLAAGGLACLTIGYGLSPWMPIVKKLWTPTFTFVASGYGFLAFALFHYLVDVRGWTRWSFPFKLIGMNAIAIYFSQAFINYTGISDFFVAGFAALVGGPFASFIRHLGAMGIRLAFLHFLYRQKLFFKV